jgi:SulP family sulfate permease
MTSTIYRRVPALASLRDYTAADFRGDLVGGLSVAAVAVPQAMAYALIVGLPPEVGLFTAIVMTTVGALLDSSKQLINGPTNAISIALLGTVGMIEDPDHRLAAVVLAGMLIGLIQLAIAFLRLGDLTRYVSHSVVVGFTAGASLLLVFDQLKNLLGQRAVGDAHAHFLVRVWRSMAEGGPVHGPTLLVGLGSIAAVLGLRFLKRRVNWPLFPEFLVVVIGAALVTWKLDLAAAGVKVVGAIPAGMPSPGFPHLDAQLIRDLAPSALAVALLGLLEAIAMAKGIAAITRQKLDLTQQCMSEGWANLAGSLFGCMPGSGSLTRSAINQQAGGRTQWAGVISALAVAATMFIFAPYAKYIPRPALAGLLIVTATRMVNIPDLRFHMRASNFDRVIVLVTGIAAFAISIEFCILIGVTMSFFLAVPRAASLHKTEFVVAPGGYTHERLESDAPDPRVLIFGLEGELFFGAAVAIEEHLEAIEGRVTPDTRVVILRLKRTRAPDAVGLAALEGFLDRLRERGVRVIVCGVRKELHEAMTRSGLLGHLDGEDVFLEQPVRQTSTMKAIERANAVLARGA